MHCNADAMSLPLKAPDNSVPYPGDVVLLMDHFATQTTVSANQIKSWTQRDPILSKVFSLTQSGWSDSVEVSTDLKPYSSRRQELSTDAGLLHLKFETECYKSYMKRIQA